MIHYDAFTHFHRFWPTLDQQYLFCQCGDILIRDGNRYREMTQAEQGFFERRGIGHSTLREALTDAKEKHPNE